MEHTRPECRTLERAEQSEVQKGAVGAVMNAERSVGRICGGFDPLTWDLGFVQQSNLLISSAVQFVDTPSTQIQN